MYFDFLLKNIGSMELCRKLKFGHSTVKKKAIFVSIPLIIHVMFIMKLFSKILVYMYT